MRRNLLLLLALCLLILNGVLAKDEPVPNAGEKSSEASEDKEPVSSDMSHVESKHPAKKETENKNIEKKPLEPKNSEKKDSEVKHSNKQNSEKQLEEEKHAEVHHVQNQQSDKKDPEVHVSDSENSKPQTPVATARQFHPPPFYQPMLFQPPSGFEAIRRQLSGGIGSDLVMMGLISLPIIGLLTMGSASVGNLLGLGASSGSKKSSSKRTRRSLKDKAADAVDYAKNLWNIMEQLETAFEKYDLYEAECRLRVVCEAHYKDRKMGSWGQSILDLMR